MPLQDHLTNTPVTNGTEPPVGGWKTKWGLILFAVGTVLIGIADKFPLEEYVPWINFVGLLLEGIGGALAGIGIAHKIEKAKVYLGSQMGTEKKVPYIVKEVGPNEIMSVRKKE